MTPTELDKTETLVEEVARAIYAELWVEDWPALPFDDNDAEYKEIYLGLARAAIGVLRQNKRNHDDDQRATAGAKRRRTAIKPKWTKRGETTFGSSIFATRPRRRSKELRNLI